MAMAVAPSIRVSAVSPGFMDMVRSCMVHMSNFIKQATHTQNWIAEISQERINEVKDKTLLKTLINVGCVFPPLGRVSA
jgi:hypothetical protein